MSKFAKLFFVALACLGMVPAFAALDYGTDSSGNVGLSASGQSVGGWSSSASPNSTSYHWNKLVNQPVKSGTTDFAKYSGNLPFLEVPAATKVPKTNATIPVVLKRSIPYLAISKGIFKALPGISTAYAIGELIQEVGCELGSDAASSPVMCPTYGQSTIQAYYIYDGAAGTQLLGYGSTPEEACAIVAENKPLHDTYFKYWRDPQDTLFSDNAGFCKRRYIGYANQNYYYTQANIKFETKTVSTSSMGAATEDQVANKIQDLASPSKMAAAINEVANTPAGAQGLADGLAAAPDDTTVSLPGGAQSVQVGQPVTVTTTTTNAAGDTITKNETTTTNATTTNNVVNYTTTTVTTTTNNTTNVTTTDSTETKPTTNPTPNEIITCGLPGTPACKIDESGTPEADSFDPSLVDPVFQPVKTCLQDPLACLPALPDLSWAFTVPTSCTAIPVNGFGEYISEIDICPFQSMFHDLMSMIWAAVGVFAAAQMLFRDSAGSA